MRRFFNRKAIFVLISIAAICFMLPGTASAQEMIANTFLSVTDKVVGVATKVFFEILILPLAAVLMALVGNLMDAAISFSLNTAYIFTLSPAVNLGWVIVRDIANMLFIFVLIYISIGTIVRGTSFGTKRLLIQLIIAAMLVNFSMFFTKAIIDVSNVFGNWLYGGIQSTLVANSAPTDITGAPAEPVGLSALIADRLGILKYWASGQSTNQTDPFLDESSSFTNSIIRLIVVLIAIYVFAYAAILFLARSIELLILLVFAPIGFVGGLLPKTKKYSDEWWNELGAVATFPVIFLLMLYISLQFINSFGILKSQMAIAGADVEIGGFDVMTYFQYFVVIFMLQATLKVAKDNAGKVGGALGGLATGLAKLAVNAGVAVGTGGSALALRTAVAAGFAAREAKPGEGVKDAKSAAWKTFRAGVPLLNNTKPFWKGVGEKVKDGSYDIRNLPLGGKNNVGSVLSDAVGVDIKAKSAKDIKKEQEDFNKEYKVEQDIRDILKQIKDIESGGLTPAQIATAQGEIKKKTSKMSNKDIETVTSRVHGMVEDITRGKNPVDKDAYDDLANATMSHFTDQLKQQQISGIMSGEASGRIKSAVQSARHRDIKKASDPLNPFPTPAAREAAIQHAISKLGPTEVAKLDIDVLDDPNVAPFLRPEHLRKIAEEYTLEERGKIRNTIESWIRLTGDHPAKKWLEENHEGKSF